MKATGTPNGAVVGTEARDDRGQGRELALLALCHLESYPSDEHGEALALLWRHPPRGEGDRGTSFVRMAEHPPARRRADALLSKLLPRRAELDEVITQISVRWRLDRMAQVDRNVLRLCAFELGQPTIPRPVVLAEAVRLARRYGSEQSPRFVNGVADALAKRLRPVPAKGAAHPVSKAPVSKAPVSKAPVSEAPASEAPAAPESMEADG
ncbi:MAG: transcription antitermination factor NusB [Myxococcota bacterium]